MKKIRIAIVGGGPSGLSILISLLQNLRTQNDMDIEVCIFEKSDQIGPGMPYSAQKACYILNLPTTSMSVDLNNSDGFAMWMHVCHPNILTKFPPRYYFGHYLALLFSVTKQAFLSKKINLQCMTCTEIEKIEMHQDQYHLYAKNDSWCADYVILSTGHMQNNFCSHLKGKDNYFHDPWSVDVQKKKPQNIGILGSRLTAIDTVLSLVDQGYSGKMFFFSRSGLLPSVLSNELHSRSLKYLTLDHFEELTLRGSRKMSLMSVLKLLCQEIDTAEGKTISSDHEFEQKLNAFIKKHDEMVPITWLEQEIDSAESKQGKPWQEVLFALCKIIPYIWRSLSLKDQKKFMKEYYSLYMTYMVAFPLDNAYKILKLLRSGQLVVVKGVDAEKVQHKDSRFIATDYTGQQYTCEMLINAMGPGYMPDIPLYRAMMDRGFIQKHHLGGINVDPHTLQVLKPNAIKHETLFAVGELTHGACLATTDMRKTLEQVAGVCYRIAKSIKNSKRQDKNKNNYQNKNKNNYQTVFFAVLSVAAVGGAYYCVKKFNP